MIIAASVLNTKSNSFNYIANSRLNDKENELSTALFATNMSLSERATIILPRIHILLKIVSRLDASPSSTSFNLGFFSQQPYLYASHPKLSEDNASQLSPEIREHWTKIVPPAYRDYIQTHLNSG